MSGPEPLAWDYSTEFQMELVTDRKRYKTGDTARILLKAPFSGEAWVTVEREKILRSFRATVGSPPVPPAQTTSPRPAFRAPGRCELGRGKRGG